MATWFQCYCLCIATFRGGIGAGCRGGVACPIYFHIPRIQSNSHRKIKCKATGPDNLSNIKISSSWRIGRLYIKDSKSSIISAGEEFAGVWWEINTINFSVPSINCIHFPIPTISFHYFYIIMLIAYCYLCTVWRVPACCGFISPSSVVRNLCSCCGVVDPHVFWF